MAIPKAKPYRGPTIIPLIPWAPFGSGRYPTPFNQFVKDELEYMYRMNDCAKKCDLALYLWQRLNRKSWGGVDISNPPKEPWGDDRNQTTLYEWGLQMLIYERAMAAHDAAEAKEYDKREACLDRCAFYYTLGIPAF